MTDLQPWQQEIVDRMPETTRVHWHDEGGGFRATEGAWELSRGFACHWVDITGPCIYPRYSGRIAISGPNQTSRALDVLAALGLPMRKGRT